MMQDLQREMTNKGVIWLLIDFPYPTRWHGWPDLPKIDETPASARKIWEYQKMAVTDWIIDWNGSRWGTQVGMTYSMQTMPEVFVIGKDGTLAYMGAIDNFQEVYNANPEAIGYSHWAIDSFLAGYHQEVRALYGEPTPTPGPRPIPMPPDRRECAVFNFSAHRARNYLREALNALLAGETVAVPETKPYGCGIAELIYGTPDHPFGPLN
jgi:hypothetical protein